MHSTVPIVPAVLLLFLGAGLCSAQPVPLDCLTGLTRYTDAEQLVYSIDASGPYLAVQGLTPGGFTQSIRLWDVSDPAAPTIASAPALWLGYEAAVLAVSYPLVVASNGEHEPGPLRVFDFSNPNAPVQSAVLGSEVYTAELLGSTLYMVEAGTLSIYDLSNPASPVMLGSLPGISAVDMSAEPGRLYLAGDAVHIIDVSNPTAPTQIGSYPSGPTGGIAHVEDTIFAAKSTGILLVIDAGDPANPSLRSQSSLSFPFPGDVEVNGSIAYVAHRGRHVGRIDVSVLDAPVTIDPLSSPAFMGAIPMARSGESLYVLGAAGFSMIDPEPPHPSGTSLLGRVGSGVLPANARIADAKFEAGIGYLCDSVNDNLIVCDAAPDGSGVINSFPLPITPRAIELAGQFAIVGGDDDELLLIDVSDPASPVVAGTVELPIGSVTRMKKGDARLLLTDGQGFAILDLTNPAEPVVLGQGNTDINEWIQDLDGNASTLAVLESSSQPGPDPYYLTVFDISNPAAPNQIGRSFLGRTGSRVSVEGNVAFVVRYEVDFKSYFPGTLASYDISMGTPQPLDSISFHRGESDIETLEFQGLLVEGATAFVSHRAGFASGLSAYDVSDPANLRLAASSPGRLADWIASDGDRMYAGWSSANSFDVYVGGLCQSSCAAADLAEPFGELNIFDLAAYLDLFNTQDPAADLAPPVGTFNFFDLAVYLDSYNAGCP